MNEKSFQLIYSVFDVKHTDIDFGNFPYKGESHPGIFIKIKDTHNCASYDFNKIKTIFNYMNSRLRDFELVAISWTRPLEQDVPGMLSFLTLQK